MLKMSGGEAIGSDGGPLVGENFDLCAAQECVNAVGKQEVAQHTESAASKARAV